MSLSEEVRACGSGSGDGRMGIDLIRRDGTGPTGVEVAAELQVRRVMPANDIYGGTLFI